MSSQNKEIELILKYKLGDNVKHEIKTIINNLLDKGIWHNDFDLAVSKQDLEDYECELLIKSLAQRNNLPHDWMNGIQTVLNNHLTSWEYIPFVVKLIDKDNVLISDHLHILRYTSAGLKWVSPRISYDGIEIEGVFNDRVKGRWFFPTIDEGEWKPFELDYQTGKIIIGEIIEFKTC